MIGKTLGDLYAARIELDQWRSGKRRVFWRVKFPSQIGWIGRDWGSRNSARRWARTFGGKVYRVTVKPKVKP